MPRHTPALAGPGSRAAIVLAAALVLFPAPPGLTQPSPCDEQLAARVAQSSLRDSPDSYRSRDDRCEGLYGGRDISTGGDGPLLVASLTSLFDRFDPKVVDALVIDWPDTGAQGVNLRAYSLRRRFYYRMDTRRPPGTRSWTWPTRVLARVALARKELGLVGSTTVRVGGADRLALVPLRVRAPGSPAGAPAVASPEQAFRLVLFSVVDLAEVYVSIARIDPGDGRVLAQVMAARPLEYGSYPAEDAIAVPLPALTPGLYPIKLVGKQVNGGNAVIEPLFLVE